MNVVAKIEFITSFFYYLCFFTILLCSSILVNYFIDFESPIHCCINCSKFWTLSNQKNMRSRKSTASSSACIIQLLSSSDDTDEPHPLSLLAQLFKSPVDLSKFSPIIVAVYHASKLISQIFPNVWFLKRSQVRDLMLDWSLFRIVKIVARRTSRAKDYEKTEGRTKAPEFTGKNFNCATYY